METSATGMATFIDCILKTSGSEEIMKNVEQITMRQNSKALFRSLSTRLKAWVLRTTQQPASGSTFHSGGWGKRFLAFSWCSCQQDRLRNCHFHLLLANFYWLGIHLAQRSTLSVRPPAYPNLWFCYFWSYSYLQPPHFLKNFYCPWKPTHGLSRRRFPVMLIDRRLFPVIVCRDRCAQSLVRQSCSRDNVVEPVGKNFSSPRHRLRTWPREGVRLDLVFSLFLVRKFVETMRASENKT